jgi:hypothetical protein
MVDVGKELQAAFDDGYKEGLTKANEWISAKDRLPEDDRNVLVYDDHDIQFWVAWHDECHNNWYTQEGDRVYGVTHWMPLPQLPKGE